MIVLCDYKYGIQRDKNGFGRWYTPPATVELLARGAEWSLTLGTHVLSGSECSDNLL